MRFEVVVLLPRKTADIIATVTDLMDPYNVEHEVPPYQERIDAEGVARLAVSFQLPDADAQGVAARLCARGEQAGVDENGLYTMTTFNPRGHWDGWILHSEQDDVTPVWALPKDLGVYDVVTPDGEWHDFGYVWDWPEEQKAASRKRARKFIQSFPDCFAVILDCHR